MTKIKISKEFVGIRLRKSTKNKLEDIATEKEMNLSELIRTILENYLVSR